MTHWQPQNTFFFPGIQYAHHWILLCYTYIKVGVSCLKWMQLQLHAVMRQVYAAGVVHEVVASYNQLQLHLQLCLAETHHLQLHLQLLAWCRMQLCMQLQLWGGRITQLQLFGTHKVAAAIGNFSRKEGTTPSINSLRENLHYINMYKQKRSSVLIFILTTCINFVYVVMEWQSRVISCYKNLN